MITTFASLARRRCATAGAAKPEKTGTWIAPRWATACEATATSGDIGRKIATRSPGSDAERRELLGEPRDVARELREGERGATAVLAEPDRRDGVGRAPAQRCTQFSAIERRPPTNHVAHSGPRDRSTTCVPAAREVEAEIVDDERPEPLGLVARAAHELRVAARTGAPLEAGHVGVLDGFGGWPPDDLGGGHGREAYAPRSLVSVC